MMRESRESPPSLSNLQRPDGDGELLPWLRLVAAKLWLRLVPERLHWELKRSLGPCQGVDARLWRRPLSVMMQPALNCKAWWRTRATSRRSSGEAARDSIARQTARLTLCQ